MVHLIKTIENLNEELSNEHNKDKLIVVDFFADWCGPCNRIAPIIEKWSEADFKEKVIFLKCDVDESEPLSEEYDVEAMPTFIFFKNGKEIHRQVGGDDKKLKEAISKQLE